MAVTYFNTACLRCEKQKIKTGKSKGFLSPYCRSCCSTIRWAKDKKPDLICKKCGKFFPFAQSGRKARVYCSRECRINQIEKICLICSKSFIVPASNANRYKQCSIKCSRSRGINSNCVKCGKEFRHSRTQNRSHCSIPCYRKSKGETSIEKKVRLNIEKLNLNFTQEFSVTKNRIYDFLIPSKNLLIECDGNYWHSLPTAIIADEKKNKTAKEFGYKLIRFSETEINTENFDKSFEEVLNRL